MIKETTSLLLKGKSLVNFKIHAFVLILFVSFLSLFYSSGLHAKDCKVRFYGDTVLLDETCAEGVNIENNCEAVTWVTVCQDMNQCKSGQHHNDINAAGIPAELFIDTNDDGNILSVSKATSVLDSNGRYRFTFKNVPCYTTKSYGNRKSALTFNLENMPGYNPMFTRVETGLDESTKNPFQDWFLSNAISGKTFKDKYNGTWFRMKTADVQIQANLPGIMKTGQNNCNGSDQDYLNYTRFSRENFLSHVTTKIVMNGSAKEISWKESSLVPQNEVDKIALLKGEAAKIQFTLVDDRWRWALQPSQSNKVLEKSIEIPVSREGNSFKLKGTPCLFSYLNKIVLTDENNNALPFSFSGQKYLFEFDSNFFKIEPIFSETAYNLFAQLPDNYSEVTIPLTIRPSRINISDYLDWSGYVKISKNGEGIKLWANSEKEPSAFSSVSPVKLVRNRNINLPVIGFSKTTSTITEADTELEIEVSLNRAYDVNVLAVVGIDPFNAQDNNGRENVDYRSFGINNKEHVIFAAGETKRNIKIKIRNDNVQDGTKKIRLSIQDPENAKISNLSKHTVIINDSFSQAPITEYSGYFEICQYLGTETNYTDCQFISGYQKSDFAIPEFEGSLYDLQYDLSKKKYKLTIQKEALGDNFTKAVKKFYIRGRAGSYSMEGRVSIEFVQSELVFDFIAEKTQGLLWRPSQNEAWDQKVFLEIEHTKQGQDYHSPKKNYSIHILPVEDSQLLNFPTDVTVIAKLKEKDGNFLLFKKGTGVGEYTIQMPGNVVGEAYKAKYCNPNKPLELELVFNQDHEAAKKWNKWQGKIYIDVDDSLQIVEGQRNGSTVPTIAVPSLFYKEVLFKPVAWYGSSLPIDLSPEELQLTALNNNGSTETKWTALGDGIYKVAVSSSSLPAVASENLTGDAITQGVNLLFSKGFKKEYQLRIIGNEPKFVEKRDGSYFEIPETTPPQLLLDEYNVCELEKFRAQDDCRRRAAISKMMGGLNSRESLPTSVTFEGELVFENNWAFEKHGEDYVSKLEATYFVKLESGVKEELAKLDISKGERGTILWRLHFSLKKEAISTVSLEALAERNYVIKVTDGNYMVEVTEKNRI